MFKIGSYGFNSQVILAPMAGVTDNPFRQLCRSFGAGLAVSEMVSANPKLRNTTKSQRRVDHRGEQAPRSVQIAGSEPDWMGAAAAYNASIGAQIIDINMGCPAKKVCKRAAGSALLKDERLVEQILKAAVAAVDIPVTLKIRTGWSKNLRNGVTIAKIAEDSGIQALAVHGRTRECGYHGEAEYDTIAAIKQSIDIPVFANGDITSPEKAKYVLDYTKADAVMIGRAALGHPWVCKEIDHYLDTGNILPKIGFEQFEEVVVSHLNSLYQFYGEYMGVRFARKHVNWYFKDQPNELQFRKKFNQLESSDYQLASIQNYFELLKIGEEIAA